MYRKLVGKTYVRKKKINQPDQNEFSLKNKTITSKDHRALENFKSFFLRINKLGKIYVGSSNKMTSIYNSYFGTKEVIS